jgi:tetratricopeptide (TPR) repeat protein
VGCEACHGPGVEHVKIAGAWEGSPSADQSMGFDVDLQRGDQNAILNSCAPCHSRRTATTLSHRIGAPFDDDYRISLLERGLYHPDGQIEAEVYVHGSFLQSKMHSAGVTCTDCHNPHSLELWLPGNATCLQCHSPEAPLDRFDSLQAKLYDSPEHHFHPSGTEGAQCVACHMPETTYMVIDPRRDHSLRIPRPDLTEDLGTPNACNACHQQETAAWAAQKIEEWYGHPPEPHYGRALGAVDGGSQEDINALVALPFDEDAASIVKASAMDLLPTGTPLAMQSAVAILGAEQSDVTMRGAALRALRGSDIQVLVAFVAPLLGDESRSIRIAAAECLAGEAEAQLTPEQAKEFDVAFGEFVDSQTANADAPFSYLNLGVVAERRGRRREALAAYRRAIELDPGFLPGVFNLATLLSTNGDPGGAKKVLLVAIERYPDEGELRYSLGLLLAELGDPTGSAAALKEAGKRLPTRPRVQYNLGLALALVGDRAGAENALLQANRLEPTEDNFIYALATFYSDSGDLALARDWAGRLVQLLPDAPGPKELVRKLDEQLNSED